MRVLIIGAGFGGLCTAIRLKQSGMDDFVVLEKDPELGGTWWANTYPGCACDVQAHLYSFSFDLNPDWSRVFAGQREILEYMGRCADRHAVRDRIRLGKEVTRAEYDEQACHWRVETAAGEVYSADVVVAALGGLSTPAIPDIPGLEDFRGEVFHSARWDPDFDHAGRRVALVGTGASAIQILPAIAPEARAVHLYQRSPAWVLPRPDRPYTPRERRLFARLPWLMRLYRWSLYARLEARALVFTVFPGLSRLIGAIGRRHIRKSIPDPGLRAQLTPDYPAGCKRILLASDYYPAFLRDNVHLHTEGIREIAPEGVVGRDGRLTEVDAVVLATGFRTTDPVPAGLFRGRGGVDLVERWREGMEAYRGMAVSGFPNLFLLMGPNTGLGHNSVVFMIEAQVRYILDCLRTMEREGLAEVEVRREVEAAFNERIQRRLRRTVWINDCSSWYKDERGRIPTLWPGFTLTYWLQARRFRPSEYRFSRRAPPHPRPFSPAGRRV